MSGAFDGDLPGAVLFVCSENVIRSPMASAILRHLSNYRVYAKSAGVRAGEADGFAVAVLEEIGIDIAGHIPIALGDLHDAAFDAIITLSPEAHHQALEFTRSMAVEVAYWPTFDPSVASGSREQVLDAYRQTRDQIFDRIKAHFKLTGTPNI